MDWTSEAAQPHAHSPLPRWEGRGGAATRGRRCLGTRLEQGSSLAGCNKALPAPSLNHSSAGSEHSVCAFDHPVQMISHRSTPPGCRRRSCRHFPSYQPFWGFLPGFKTASGHDGSVGGCSCPAPTPSPPALAGGGMRARWMQLGERESPRGTGAAVWRRGELSSWLWNPAKQTNKPRGAVALSWPICPTPRAPGASWEPPVPPGTAPRASGLGSEASGARVQRAGAQGR